MSFIGTGACILWWAVYYGVMLLATATPLIQVVLSIKGSGGGAEPGSYPPVAYQQPWPQAAVAEPRRRR